MIKVVGVLMGASILAGLTGCAAPPAPTPAVPVPEQRPPSDSPASDSCAELTAADVRAAIAALPGWSYDLWSTSEELDGTPQGPSAHSRVEFLARGSIIIGDRYWVYTASPEGSAFDLAEFPIWLERLFRSRARSDRSPFPSGATCRVTAFGRLLASPIPNAWPPIRAAERPW
jgi:hypothetical protein